MQTYTPKEKAYLRLLMERNFKNEFRNQTEPLNKPMSVEERKLRSRIGKKCRIYSTELAVAEKCGIIPDKEMKEAGCESASQFVYKIGWALLLGGMQKNSAQPRQPDLTKWLS